MSDYKEVMKWYSENKKEIYDTFALNHQLGINSHFQINDQFHLTITPEGYPNVGYTQDPERQYWRFRFLQNRLQKFLSNTVQSLCV